MTRGTHPNPLDLEAPRFRRVRAQGMIDRLYAVAVSGLVAGLSHLQLSQRSSRGSARCGSIWRADRGLRKFSSHALTRRSWRPMRGR